ncbi:MAG: amino acid adenylation domain-containing protein [Actinomycetota bacterium]|nr:amino acid adenylation domain-containing protein [Actinomycetota bacterium]
MLRASALAHPDRTAVSCGQDRLTFRQLNERGERIAGHLRRLRVAPDEPVGIFMEPSVDLMTSVWGVLHAGSAYLPLSPDYPDERIRYMIADSQTRIILVDESLTRRLSRLAPPETQIITLAQAGEDHGATAVGPRQLGSLAYVIYTSGSTGRPKGIEVEHRGIVNQMRWLAAACGLDGSRTVLQKTPLSFDAAQWEILAPACGSTVVMSEPGVYGDPERLIELIMTNSITAMQGVPTLWQALVDTGRLSRCTSLTQIFSGGEALSKSLAVELLDALPGCELVNLYGPSECTINTSAHTVDPDTVQYGPDVIPIGKPVDGVAYYILDENRSPVAPGASGELHISGVQLARGYLNRPDLTADRFTKNPFSTDPRYGRLYRTGDLARWNADGSVQFLGRTDSQVKLRGFRVELDEIKVAIEAHDWIKRAAVVVREDPRTGANLVAFTELDPTKAAVMDQGNHGAHHQSKQSKVQLTAQLSNLGHRDDPDRPRVELPGSAPTAHQRQKVFARKTYRFFEGGEVTRDDILQLLAERPPRPAGPRVLETLTLAELGEVLRYFGQFPSTERLLPKHGYASPGSLYATQLYLELSGVAGIESGHYYYHPVEHALLLIRKTRAVGPVFRVHFIGRRSAIEPVYRDNIQEVLQFEAGHMIGLFDAVLPAYGLRIAEGEPAPEVKDELECADEDYYLATFEVATTAIGDADDVVDFYVQAHPGRIADLPGGQYHYVDGDLRRVSDELVLKRHVIAINQQVYERASFGISLLSSATDPWTRYVDLGRALQRLQMNSIGLGLMSSGYSSETGHDLLSARRIAEVLGTGHGVASYFAVGGRVSEEQRLSDGMKEDAVHMRGPAEIIKDDLAERLPRYMVPNRVTVLDAFPLTANGKIDVPALRALDKATADHTDAPIVAPRTPTEEAIAGLWQQALKRSSVSIRDDFFASGGHSLTAVSLIGQINREMGVSLPLQVLFESPTIAELARRVDRDSTTALSRLVRLRADGARQPIFCWPGLGGYPMSLRLLASKLHMDRPVYGVQAHGINPGEVPYSTFAEMAERDIELIRRVQPTGPYVLWGYSFGARLAFEVAHRLERAGERVENLILLAPGKPPVESDEQPVTDKPLSFDDTTFVSILFSVFAGNLDQPALGECLAATKDEDTFIAFVLRRFEHLDEDLVRRLVGVVRQTFRFEYTGEEFAERRIVAPVTVFTAGGDQDSFIDGDHAHLLTPPTIVRLEADHYSLLRTSGIDELIDAIALADTRRKALAVPHVSIKHFPHNLDADQTSDLVLAITSAVKTAFACDEGAVSIALEPVAQDAWNERVYVPEIVNSKGTLVKVPNY